MASGTKAKATPKQLRRTGMLVAAFALFVAIAFIYNELDYASFSESALRVDARIAKVEAVREGKRLRHILHYDFDHGGKVYGFSDKAGRETKLEELYAGTFNAFSGDDPPLQAGGTISLLVNPTDASDHRADRAKLSLPSVTWAAPLLGVLFLSGVAAFLFWIAREPPRAGSSAPPPPKTQRSQVSSSREDGVLRVRAKVDVPWPAMSAVQNDEQDMLRERMRALKAERSDEAPRGLPAGEHAGSAAVRFELSPEEDAQLYEARIDFIGASGERASELVQRAVMLRGGAIEKLDATVKIPSAAKTLRLVLVLADRTTWQHDIAL
jgi:hypothetical protein